MDALEQEGIPALLRTFEETPYTGLFIPQRGWGCVMVPEGMEALAREVIRSLAEDDEFDEQPAANTYELEPRLWDMLRKADPEEITRTAVVEYDLDDNVYIVPFLNTAILCSPEAEEIEVVGDLAPFSKDFHLNLVLLHYLLGAQNRPVARKWVGEKDLPAGRVFFTGSHALPGDSLADAFDARPELLDAGARRIGGERVELGDLSYQFRFLSRIPLLAVFWIGDDEFEPSFHFLFDETIMLHLESLDLVWGLVNVFTRILMHSAASVPESE
ncbi:MAG: DUF3786 domain-containing protein [Desulfobacteraceae bacterium]|nr:DUF3786 domain-containing protein [Desulfobacteraceae bacterium]